jgi:murein L,D-transpeptidase YafK
MKLLQQCLIIFSCVGWFHSSNAQSLFLQEQKANLRVDQAFKQKEDTIKKQFAAAKLSFPPKQIYLRSFKYDSEIEVWVRSEVTDTFKLFKTYKVCALSGSLGPKRMEGDFQVPEGFYHINEFNPKSMYHLSLGINYPNVSDEILSDSVKPGGDIYVHGGCVTVGCIPVKDSQIEELYLLATYAKENGQDFIPIHIFPVKYDNTKSYRYLALSCKDNKEYQTFVITLQEAYDYFNHYKKIPIIAVGSKGEYYIIKTGS